MREIKEASAGAGLPAFNHFLCSTLVNVVVEERSDEMFAELHLSHILKELAISQLSVTLNPGRTEHVISARHSTVGRCD